MTVEMGGIFISYRREDTAPYAGRLNDNLSRYFGDDRVFMDLKIEPGEDFVRRIDDAVSSCDAMVHLIGPEWSGRGAEGRRLDDPEDFVRIEIEAALAANVRLIPAIVDGAEMPHERDVPPSLAPMVRLQAHELSDKRWDYDVEILVGVLERVMETSPEREPAHATPVATSEADRRAAPHSLQRRRFARSEADRRWRRMFAGTRTAQLLDDVATADQASPAPGGWARGRRRAVWLAAAVIALAAAGLAFAMLPGDAGMARETFPVGREPTDISVTSDAVWVSSHGDQTVSRIDPGSGAVVGEPVPIEGTPVFLAAGEGAVWVTDEANHVSRIDASTSELSREPIKVGVPLGVDVSNDAVWVSINRGREKPGGLVRLDPRSGEIQGSPIPVGNFPWGIAAGPDAVWVANEDDDTVSRIDPNVGRTVGEPIVVGDGPRGIAIGEGGVWVANSKADTVVRIDLRSGDVGDPIPVGRLPYAIAVADGSVWVANEGSNSVSRIDARTSRVLDETIPVGASPQGISAMDGYVWVANGTDNSVTRLAP
jgi:YVTN family beta-propeller protein